jgi:hypothetical protein
VLLYFFTVVAEKSKTFLFRIILYPPSEAPTATENMKNFSLISFVIHENKTKCFRLYAALFDKTRRHSSILPMSVRLFN